MPCPQVHYRLAVDGDRHRRTNFALPREVPGKRLAHSPEARIAHAADSNISGRSVHHMSPSVALGNAHGLKAPEEGLPVPSAIRVGRVAVMIAIPLALLSQRHVGLVAIDTEQDNLHAARITSGTAAARA
jgi:hypothetical protein